MPRGSSPSRLLALLLVLGCSGSPAAEPSPDGTPRHAKADPLAVFGRPAPAPAPGRAVAVFAGGCFWCMEKPFDQLDGVLATTSGYTGGPQMAPRYEEVSSHQTGHAEALRVLYDPSRVSYARLLDVFWHNIDPTQDGGQFCDKGQQYRAGIYTNDPAERALALASRAEVARRLGAGLAVEIEPLGPFWPAEDYHQDFYEKNPTRYQSYRAGCGRDRRLGALWKEAAVRGAGEEWVRRLSGEAGTGEAAP